MTHGLTAEDIARLQAIVDERSDTYGSGPQSDRAQCRECGDYHPTAGYAAWCCR